MPIYFYNSFLTTIWNRVCIFPILPCSEFQEMAGLSVTGKMNEETLEKMLAPRCGMPDVIKPSERKPKSGNPQRLNKPLEFNTQGTTVCFLH